MNGRKDDVAYETGAEHDQAEQEQDDPHDRLTQPRPLHTQVREQVVTPPCPLTAAVAVVAAQPQDGRGIHILLLVGGPALQHLLVQLDDELCEGGGEHFEKVWGFAGGGGGGGGDHVVIISWLLRRVHPVHQIAGHLLQVACKKRTICEKTVYC